MADLENMSKDELLKLCHDRGGQLIQFVKEFQHSANIAIDKHTELQAEHAARLAEFEDLKAQHEQTLKRLDVAEKLVEQQTAENRRLRDFGRFLLKKENTSD